MKVQSLSVVVPSTACINDCRCCVSKMHQENYPDITRTIGDRCFDDEASMEAMLDQYRKRLMFARDNGCNMALLTGTAEPQQNFAFLRHFGWMNKSIRRPFHCIDVQTTGAAFTDETFKVLREIGVTNISVSLFSFDSDANAICRGRPGNDKLYVSPHDFCKDVKRRGFNLRICVNLTKYFDMPTEKFFMICEAYDADQVTIRELYATGAAEQAKWIGENAASGDFKERLRRTLEEHAIVRRTEIGQAIYDVNGMGVVYDADCMSKQKVADTDLRYLVLRPNGKLYSSWDSKASLVF